MGGGVVVMPQRIQRKRTKNWRMPDGAVYVGRSSRWGNPYKVVGPIAGEYGIERRDTVGVEILDVNFEDKQEAMKFAVDLFKLYAAAKLYSDPHWLEPLRGYDLACWCGLDEPCHADVLLRLANESEGER